MAADVFCYTGEGGRRDGVHTPRQFAAIARRLCKKDCPADGAPRAWAHWAGADVLAPGQEPYCRYTTQGARLLKAIAGPLAAGQDATVSRRGRDIVVAGAGKAVRIPLDDLTVLREWMEVSRSAATAPRASARGGARPRTAAPAREKK